MHKVYLSETELPFCKGCGHALISENTDKALQKLGIPLLDVILVTDIGCHGIIDKCFKTHTVHGLHGRSVALASGITAGLNNPDKKVIAFIGDGGATIGMQHLIDAAHHKFNLTVVLHNNFLYGMTGGQPSEFTPCGFKTPTHTEGAKRKGFDICEMITAAGATYVSRVIGIGDFSEQLAAAYAKKGFSLVEVMEVCPSYAVKSNPGMKLARVVEEAGLAVKVFADNKDDAFTVDYREQTKSLIDEKNIIAPKYTSSLKGSMRIMINGSAGEGVQLAAEFFAKSAVSAGLNVTKKGSYPVTVGIGFSSSDIIISSEKILYTGSVNPDVVIIISKDGLDFAQSKIKNMNAGIVYIDSSLEAPVTKAKVIKINFRGKVPVKNSALYSLFYFLHHSSVFSLLSLTDAVSESPVSAKMDLSKFMEF
ncbi:MAG: thiamine pyrophosphate-dependent enzyme [Bacteroidota bacterium]